jgi:hypothetical protein
MKEVPTMTLREVLAEIGDIEKHYATHRDQLTLSAVHRYRELDRAKEVLEQGLPTPAEKRADERHAKIVDALMALADKGGPRTRSELVTHVNGRKAEVRDVLSTLIADGLLVEVTPDRRGRPRFTTPERANTKETN